MRMSKNERVRRSPCPASPGLDLHDEQSRGSIHPQGPPPNRPTRRHRVRQSSTPLRRHPRHTYRGGASFIARNHGRFDPLVAYQAVRIDQAGLDVFGLQPRVAFEDGLVIITGRQHPQDVLDGQSPTSDDRLGRRKCQARWRFDSGDRLHSRPVAPYTLHALRERIIHVRRARAAAQRRSCSPHARGTRAHSGSRIRCARRQRPLTIQMRRAAHRQGDISKTRQPIAQAERNSAP